MNAPANPAALADYPVTIRWPIQWGDQDAFGHVNNTVYFRWFESARIAYFEQSSLGTVLRAAGLGPILASITCHYKRQLKYPDWVWIGSRISRIGRSSMSMQHAVYSEQLGVVAAEGDSVVVIFDYRASASCPVPLEAREAIAGIEGKTFPASSS